MAVEHNTDGSLKKSALITQAHTDSAQALTTAQNAASTATAAQNAVAGKLDTSQLGAANGIATLNSSGQLQQTVNAAKITAGVFDIQRIPDLSTLYLTLAQGLTITSYDGTATQLKLISLVDGSIRAVPQNATSPAAPQGVAVEVHLSFVKFSWQAVSDATKYLVYRDGVQLKVTTNLLYTDTSVSINNTYHYYVYAVNQYGMQSPASAVANALIDPALNAAPSLGNITIWPQNPTPNDIIYVHVNASDVDTQVLAMTLNVNVGSLIPTFDPSTWIWDES